MQSYFLVAAGGAVGAVMRYGLSRALPVTGVGWPTATLLANALGGLLIGILGAYAFAKGQAAEPLRLLLGVGVLGGFTTFSAFSLEAVLLAERGRLGLAGAYVLASVTLAVLAAFAGLWLARRWWA